MTLEAWTPVTLLTELLLGLPANDAMSDKTLSKMDLSEQGVEFCLAGQRSKSELEMLVKYLQKLEP